MEIDMEKKIIEEMKKNKEIQDNFTDEELDKFLKILICEGSDVKKQEQFIELIERKVK